MTVLSSLKSQPVDNVNKDSPVKDKISRPAISMASLDTLKFNDLALISTTRFKFRKLFHHILQKHVFLKTSQSVSRSDFENILCSLKLTSFFRLLSASFCIRLQASFWSSSFAKKSFNFNCQSSLEHPVFLITCPAHQYTHKGSSLSQGAL